MITIDKERRILKDGSVYVEDKVISDIGLRIDLEKYKKVADTVIDCKGGIILPGLINCHSHAGHSLMGKLGGDMMNQWWDMLVSVYENYADEHFWRIDGSLHACSALRNGITTTLNVLGSTPMGDDSSLAQGHAEGYASSGGRLVLGVGIPYSPSYPKIYHRWKNGHIHPLEVGVDQMLAGTEETLRYVHQAYDGRTRVFVTPHQQLMEHKPGETCPANLTTLTSGELSINAKVRSLAEKYDTQIYTDTYGGWITLAYTDKVNMLLGKDVLLGIEHSQVFNYRDLEILAETGTKVYYTAEGIYRRFHICDAMQMGIPVAITTNGCAPRTMLDLLESLRRAILAERLFNDDMSYFPAARALESVTIDAALCLGLEDEIGSLEVGKKADIIVYRSTKSVYPNENPIEKFIYSASGGDFPLVMVDGRILLEDFRLTEIDEQSVLLAANEMNNRIISDLNLYHTIDKPIWGKTRMELI